MTDRPLVSIGIVTYNSAPHIEACLGSVRRQSFAPLEVLVVDNHSSDESVERVEGSETPLRLLKNERNRGFAAAHNQAIRSSHGEHYLALNPDIIMRPNFVEEMVKAIELDSGVGSVSGKLLRPTVGCGPSVLDSTGIYMTPNLRHLDRGSGQEDRGQYDQAEYVFGASGAAALYRRRMLEDVAIDGEYFDEDFFAYREDADLAWRAQLLGWRAVYTPRALATHERRVLPERRASLPNDINMHSVKNRFLLRIKNQTLTELFALLPPALVRDLQVLCYVALFERSSLPGLVFVARSLRKTWSKRRQIMARRRVASRDMLRWFRRRPVSFALERLEELAPITTR